MLAIVMAKPMQFTSVSPVPLSSFGTDEATRLENWGESAVTAIPQMHHTVKKRDIGIWNKKGDERQNNPEIESANKATL